MINTTKSFPFMDRAIAIVTVATLLVWSIGLFAFVNNATAASLTNVSNTLSDSRPSETSTSTVTFSHAEELGAGDTIVVTFPGDFTLGAAGDVTCPSDWTADVTGQEVTCTANTAITGPATTTVVVGGVTNPASTGSYEFYIEAGTDGDPEEEGYTRVMIVDSVSMTASVDTTFTFSVFGTATGTAIVGTATTTASTTPTTLPFGTLEPGTEYFLGQELHVATNASNGFVVTLEQFDFMRSATDDTISTFPDYDGSNGTAATTPSNWAAPGATLDNTNEYGHYGLTSRDTGLDGDTGDGDDDFAACGDSATKGCYVGNFNQSPRNVFAHTGPVNGDTDTGSTAGEDGKEWSRVGIRMEITALQAAAPDYNTELMYIATPTF